MYVDTTLKLYVTLSWPQPHPGLPPLVQQYVYICIILVFSHTLTWLHSCINVILYSTILLCVSISNSTSDRPSIGVFYFKIQNTKKNLKILVQHGVHFPAHEICSIEWSTKLPLMTSFIFMGLMEHCQQNSTVSERVGIRP